MQYILTQNELDALAPKTELTLQSQSLSAAREQILKSSGFACIHNKNVEDREIYCDDCPCSPLADDHDYDTWERICWLPKEYSQ